ncbi:MAG: LacI family transcriptional regulator [Candidatus Frackibacter sp. T328-2]|nr:MAG: LacI family transcriptional regulator [Candidatus Frackibacter sp. T328-2]
MGITIKDVARKANTSVATVSRVMNNSTNVSPDLKKRVQKVINELNYQPNEVAKSLKKEKTNMVGVLISDITNPFFSSIVKGIEDVLDKENYTVILGNTAESVDIEEKYINKLINKQIDGFIISSTSDYGNHFSSIIDENIPLIFVNRRPEGYENNLILTDNFKGGYIATKHLIELGHKKIGAILGPQNLNTGIERKRGYEAALRDNNIEIKDKYIKIGDFKRQSGYNLSKELVNNDDPPTSIFVSNNEMTLGVVEALNKLNINIPKELSLVGFDYSEWMRVVSPRITCVVQQAYQMGEEAAKRMLYLLKKVDKKNNNNEKYKKVLSPEFLNGNSTRYLGG